MATLPPGSACSTVTVLVCPECKTIYADDRAPDGPPGHCGPCDQAARHREGRRVLLRRRKRRRTDTISLSFRA